MLPYFARTRPYIHEDQYSLSQQVTLWKTGNDLCPVKAAWNFIPHHPTGTGPFFTYANGTFLTRRRWSDIIQSIIPEVNINTHSFRIGGASAAAAAGIPDSTIQILGRWSSEAYKLYLWLPESTFCEASSKMARMKKCTITYSPKREWSFKQRQWLASNVFYHVSVSAFLLLTVFDLFVLFRPHFAAILGEFGGGPSSDTRKAGNSP